MDLVEKVPPIFKAGDLIVVKSRDGWKIRVEIFPNLTIMDMCSAKHANNKDFNKIFEEMKAPKYIKIGAIGFVVRTQDPNEKIYDWCLEVSFPNEQICGLMNTENIQLYTQG